MTQFLRTISNEEINLLPKAAFAGRIEIIDSEKNLDEACNYLLAQKAIGFDTETRPAFKAGTNNKVALLQLSSADRCFLFRLCSMRLDKALIKILENRDILKVGAAVRDDIRALQALRHFKPDGFIDLQNIVNQWGIEEKSVRKVAAVVLGIGVSKAQRLSNWEAASFTEAQASYAATDAWVCLEIYKKLMSSAK
jgi:ribonuclease D